MAAKEENLSTSINDLTNELLVEILCRLSNRKWMIRCRSVCKRWFHLIFDNYFMQRFKSHYSSHPSFAIVIRPSFHHYFKDHILLKPQFNTQIPQTTLDGSGFKLSYSYFSEVFDRVPEKVFHNVKVIGNDNDLILCYNRLVSLDHIFYICNPQTKDWVQLPKPLFNPCSDFQAALICKKYVSHYRYRVVAVFRGDGLGTQLKGYIFSSDKGKWDQVVLRLPESYVVYIVWGDSLVYDDMICLYNRRGNGMVVFDPFADYNEDDNTNTKSVVDCHFVYWPEDEPYRHLKGYPVKIGICQGVLKLCCYKWQAGSLSVWKLNDYCRKDWSLEYKIALTDVVSGPRNHICLIEDVVGLHPFCEGIVYVQTRSLVMICDLTRRMVEKVFVIPEKFKLLGGFSYVHWVSLPLHPTPLVRSQN